MTITSEFIPVEERTARDYWAIDKITDAFILSGQFNKASEVSARRFTNFLEEHGFYDAECVRLSAHMNAILDYIETLSDDERDQVHADLENYKQAAGIFGAYVPQPGMLHHESLTRVQYESVELLSKVFLRDGLLETISDYRDTLMRNIMTQADVPADDIDKIMFHMNGLAAFLADIENDDPHKLAFYQDIHAGLSVTEDLPQTQPGPGLYPGPVPD
ncbi:MAG: hypothetical protein QF692_00365 [Alphaproteobacteria bacterium]|jgi:hypothetical protein|nr:hypothetical protein [Alphaproteobacteria bacterium]MDP7221700.1 hypothetical protein [Alphaproteobacteria bacterium]